MINNEKITVCYFGTYRSEYSRNRIMIKGLRNNNVNVIECHENLWTGIDDRVNAINKGLINPELWIRILRVYLRLFKKFQNLPDFDVLVVGYPGQFDVFFAKFLTIFKGKPIVWDVFMSIYLVSLERNLHKKNPISVNFLKFIEYIALRIPNKLIIDTQQYANWFNQIYKISTNRFCFVPTGADDDVFNLDQFIEYHKKEKFIVLYYGTFIPNHGVPYIIESAKCIENEKSILYQFIGTGPELDLCLEMVENYNLKNIEFISWMEQKDLIQYIRKADIVLGAFGNTPQSLMTVQNKIYESMAMGKLVVTGDSEAINNQFTNYKEIILCDRGEPENLATIIKELYDNPDLINIICKNANKKYSCEFSISKNGLRFLNCLSPEQLKLQ